VIADPPAGHARAKFWQASAALRSGNPALTGTRGLMPGVFGVMVMDWRRNGKDEKQDAGRIRNCAKLWRTAK